MLTKINSFSWEMLNHDYLPPITEEEIKNGFDYATLTEIYCTLDVVYCLSLSKEETHVKEIGTDYFGALYKQLLRLDIAMLEGKISCSPTWQIPIQQSMNLLYLLKGTTEFNDQAIVTFNILECSLRAFKYKKS